MPTSLGTENNKNEKNREPHGAYILVGEDSRQTAINIKQDGEGEVCYFI